MAARCGSISPTPARWPTTTARVAALLARERRHGLCELATYGSFAEQVKRTKRKLLSFLIAAKDAGKTICGYGAPGKGNTLLNYCGIGTDFLEFTVDRNPYKHGRFTPGMHVPIHPVDAIDALKPDYVLILPWNLKDEIVQQMRHVGDWGGKFIVPIPELAVIDPKEPQIMKVVLFCGGPRHPHPRIFRKHPEADDPGRPSADSLACHAVLQRVRASGFHPDPGVQGQHHQGVLSELPPAGLCRLRGLGLRRQCRAAERARGGLARHADRHRDLAQHRRAAVGGARPRQGRGDLPRQLQRRSHRREPRRHGRRASGGAASSPASSRSGRR